MEKGKKHLNESAFPYMFYAKCPFSFSSGVTECNPSMNELVWSPPEWQSYWSTFQWGSGPNERLCSPSRLPPGKLINSIVVSCLDRNEFCQWIQHFKTADVPVMSPPPPVYDIIYTPTSTEASDWFLGQDSNYNRCESVDKFMCSLK